MITRIELVYGRAVMKWYRDELARSQEFTLRCIQSYGANGTRIRNPRTLQDCEVLEERGLVHQIITRGHIRWVAGQPETACGRMVAGCKP